MASESKELTLHEKLIDIQQRLKVPKDKRNEYSTSKFMYRNLEAIEEAVKPMLKEHKLILTFSDRVIAVGDRVFVEATAYLNDGTDTVKVAAYAQHATDKKGMDDAQLTGSCSSYARKYAAGGLFLIDETKDADSMDNSQQNAPKTATKQFPQLEVDHQVKGNWQPSVDRPVSAQQKMTIATWLKAEGVEGQDDISAWMYDNFGALPSNELEAFEVINSLEAKEPNEKR
jgi:hypothetical protein